jgi:hypothetical protein
MMGVMVHACYTSYQRNDKIEGYRSSLGKKQDPISKITRHKRARDVAQVEVMRENDGGGEPNSLCKHVWKYHNETSSL